MLLPTINKPMGKRGSRPTPGDLLLLALRDDPSSDLYGLDLATLAGLLPRKGYPAIARLESLGLVTSRWDEVEETTEGGPRRRLYRLSLAGIEAAKVARSNAVTDMSTSAAVDFLRHVGHLVRDRGRRLRPAYLRERPA